MSDNQVKDQSHPLLLGELIQANDIAQIEAVLAQSSPAEMARLVSGIGRAGQNKLFPKIRITDILECIAFLR